MNKEQYEFFKNKKVLYIIPHEDDEVNMSGGMIYWLSKVGVSTHIVFVTNGDYRTSAEIRIKEAYKSLHVLGVKEENVHFLGYSDQATHGTGHLYQSENWKSRNGMESSYIPNSITVQFGIKILQPQLFTKDNLIKDIIHVIDEIRPDIIFAVDFDSHADHRSVSLCFDAAVGKIIKNNVFYRPIIYKVFAYPTAYKGYKDFYGEILPDTKFNIENFNYAECQNPYFLWDERIKFALPLEARTRRLSKNVKFKALSQYRSQSIKSRADRIINGDEVAWQRRTDNLMFNAKVSVSSGNPEYLNDFLLFDCSNIMNGDSEFPKFDKGVWIPTEDDELPEITIHLPHPEIVSELVFYQSAASEQKVLSLTVNFDDKILNKYEYIGNRLKWSIKLSYLQKVSTIKITICSKNGDSAGFSELELFGGRVEQKGWILPLYEGNIIYPYTTCRNYDRQKISAWIYDGVETKQLSFKILTENNQNQLLFSKIEESRQCITTDSNKLIDRLNNTLYNKILLKFYRCFYALRRFYKKFITRKY